jgi:hypothetical protein
MTRALATEKLRRPLAVWWTVLVAVLFSIAPTLTHAIALAHGDNIGIEICTAQGSRSVAPDTAHAVDSSTGQDSTASLQHCPFCLQQADRIAPPPNPRPDFFKAQGGQQQIADWQVFSYLDNTPLWAPPRGPPTEISH